MSVALSLSIIAVICIVFVNTSVIDTSGWFGAEYTPSSASNSLWWYNYQNYTQQIDTELGFIQNILKFNSLRMFLHTLNYQHLGSTLFIEYIDDFLTKCSNHNIKAGFVFFGDCSFNQTIQNMDKPCLGTPGCSNGCWIASPQSNQRDINNITQFKSYVIDIVNKFKNDQRVLFWEVYNEPNNQNKGGLNYSYTLRDFGYEWIKSMNPIQPIISCWDDNIDTEIIDIHRYNNNFGSNWIPDIQSNINKSAVITEGGSRWMPGHADAGSPIEVIHFLQQYKMGQPVKNNGIIPGIFICWEVMVGNTMTRWYWGIQPGRPEPVIPFDAHLFPDGTPISYTEVGIIRQYITNNESEFVLLDTFLPKMDNLNNDYWLTLNVSNNMNVWIKELNKSSLYYQYQYGFLIEVSFDPSPGKSDFFVNIPLNDNVTNETLVVYCVEVDSFKMNLNLYQNEELMETFNISTLIPMNGVGVQINGWNILRNSITWELDENDNNNLNISISIWLNQMAQNAKQERIHWFGSLSMKQAVNGIMMQQISLEEKKTQTLVDYVSVLPYDIF